MRARPTGLWVGVANTFGINALVGLALGQPTETPKKAVDGIRDNSFLIEEAYNQEAGVVQHIWTGRFGADHRGEPSTRSLDLSFTQEWPVFGQTHQLSYTVPYAFLDEDGEHESGIGDVLLNYRYQLFQDEGAFPAVTPRFSVILPSGDEDRGFGSGTVGYEFKLPVSKTLSDRVYVNFNAGVTYLPDVNMWLSDDRRSSGLDLLGFNLGGSVIYAVTDEFHF
ncbi:MAG: transporter, partial [Planctomycetota bacterium]